jgi:ribonuclease D
MQVIGVDTESKPDFRKHKRGNPVCLIQLATLDRAFIYRLQRGQPLPPVLRELFEDARVLKVGHSLNDDFRLLKASELVRAVNSTIDTLPIANKLGCLRPGLRTLGQLFLGGSISKDMQVSNWEASVLSDAQISYAATDAWAPLRGEVFPASATHGSLIALVTDLRLYAVSGFDMGSAAGDGPAGRHTPAPSHQELQLSGPGDYR